MLFGRLGYSKDSDFIVYDDEGGGWAGRFVWTLDMIGHRRWRYLNGGIHAWAAAGGELAAGAGAAPDPREVSITLHPEARASLDDVLAAIDDPNQQIWDVRSAEEHQGLRSGSARAGHIPGAVNLDWLLLKNPDDQQRLHPDMAALLETHGIDLSKRIITHCQTHHRSGLSYMVARLLGSTDIRAYDGSWSEWGNRDDVPVVR
jgi:thiosulfate/3-mercaptopyruvate sulfurtransferase